MQPIPFAPLTGVALAILGSLIALPATSLTMTPTLVVRIDSGPDTHSALMAVPTDDGHVDADPHPSLMAVPSDDGHVDADPHPSLMAVPGDDGHVDADAGSDGHADDDAAGGHSDRAPGMPSIVTPDESERSVVLGGFALINLGIFVSAAIARRRGVGRHRSNPRSAE